MSDVSGSGLGSAGDMAPPPSHRYIVCFLMTLGFQYNIARHDHMW